MKRRYSILTAMLLVLTIVLSACGTGNTNTGSTDATNTQTDITSATVPETKPTEKVELTMYSSNQSGADYLKVMKETVIGKYQEQHPNITINMTLNIDPTGIEKQQLAAGAGPDIVTLDGPTSLQMFANAGYVLPLDEYISKYGWDKTFQSWALDTCKKDGKLFGLPGGVEGLIVYYNKTMFTDNGWQVPKTYAEFLDLCKKIKDKSIVPFSFGCSDFRQANEWWVSMAYNAVLGNDEFKKFLSGEKNWDDVALKDATQKLVDMWGNGFIYEKSAMVSLDDAKNLFATKKAAMNMSGTWFISEMLAAKPEFEWSTFAMPQWNESGKQMVPMALSTATGVNANSKHPAEAAEFLNWMWGKEVGTEILKLGGDIYALNDFDISLIEGVDAHVTETNNIIEQASKDNNTGYCSWTYWSPNTETFVWNNLEGLYFGQMKIDDFMTKLNKEYEKDKAKGSLFKFSN